jgi:hypothetical protein
MPRKKNKPALSSDLVPHGDGILKGVSYDPFEPTVYRIKGQVPGFINLAILTQLESGPEILESTVFRAYNPEDKAVCWTVTLSTVYLLQQLQLSNTVKREYLQSRKESGSKLVIRFDLDPKESKSFKLLVSTYGGVVDVEGQLVFKAKFNES